MAGEIPMNTTAGDHEKPRATFPVPEPPRLSGFGAWRLIGIEREGPAKRARLPACLRQEVCREHVSQYRQANHSDQRPVAPPECLARVPNNSDEGRTDTPPPTRHSPFPPDRLRLAGHGQRFGLSRPARILAGPEPVLDQVPIGRIPLPPPHRVSPQSSIRFPTMPAATALLYSTSCVAAQDGRISG